MSGMLVEMGRGNGQLLEVPAATSVPRSSLASSILYGTLKQARPLGLRHRPMLMLEVPESVKVDRMKLREILNCIGLYTMAPSDPERADPLGYLHLRFRRQIENLRQDQVTPASPEEAVTFPSSQMACLKLPQGNLDRFKLTWNEWDMTLGAISWAYGETKNEDYARLYRSLIDEEPTKRAGRICCVRCGAAMHIEEAVADPRAYRCEICAPVD